MPEQINVRVEYEVTPIRHVAVQCPYCHKWFHGNEISDKPILDNIDLEFAVFTCPICGATFSAHNKNSNPWTHPKQSLHITETAYPEVYKDCWERHTEWKPSKES